MSAEAIQECVDNLTPRFFDGARDKRRGMYPKFFRDVIFSTPDKTTSKRKAYWREITRETPQFVAPLVTPCDDFTYVNNADQWEEKEVTFPYVQIGASIDCDYDFYVRGDESCDGDRELGEAIETDFAEEQRLADESMDIREDMWAAEATLTGRVTLEGKGIKKHFLSYKRDNDLNIKLTGDDMWGKDSCANPFNVLDSANNTMFCKGRGNSVTHWIMSQETCDKMMESPLLQDCLKGFNPRMFLPDIVNSPEISLQPKAPFMGGKLAYVLRGQGMVNQQIWCVKAFYDFKDPVTGQLVKTDLLPFGKVFGFDLSGSPDSFNAGFIYGGIRNHHAGRNRALRRYDRAWIPENGKSLKYTVESAPLPVIRCPNASVEIEVCKAA